MDELWCFAYGSNLLREQIKRRIGHIPEAPRAWLEGYRLAFNKLGGDGTGKANIVKQPGTKVWGVVYRCSPEDLDKMDSYEGVAKHPIWFGHRADGLCRTAKASEKLPTC